MRGCSRGRRARAKGSREGLARLAALGPWHRADAGPSVAPDGPGLAGDEAATHAELMALLAPTCDVRPQRAARCTFALRWLILRDLPLKERFAVVDTASITALVPLRNPIRARSEKCLLIVRARETSATCRWVLTVKCLEL